MKSVLTRRSRRLVVFVVAALIAATTVDAMHPSASVSAVGLGWDGAGQLLSGGSAVSSYRNGVRPCDDMSLVYRTSAVATSTQNGCGTSKDGGWAQVNNYAAQGAMAAPLDPAPGKDSSVVYPRGWLHLSACTGFLGCMLTTSETDPVRVATVTGDVLGLSDHYRFTSPLPAPISDASGSLRFDPDSITWDPGDGQTLYAITVNRTPNAIVRIRGSEVIPFADAPTTDGFAKAVAVTGYGSYVAVGLGQWGTPGVYDLTNCAPVATVAGAAPGCSFTSLHDLTGGLFNASGSTRVTALKFQGRGDVLTFQVTNAGPGLPQPSGFYTLRSAAWRPSAPRVVALGDSYASGEGTLDYATTDTDRATDPRNMCHRSLTYSWPARVAESLGLGFTSFACSGSTTDQIIAGAWANNEVSQLDALASDIAANGEPSMIVMTTGAGNSIGFADEVVCLVMAGDCTDHADQTAARIKASFEQTAYLLSTVRRLAPGSPIYVTGYPRLVAPATSACAGLFGLSTAEMTYAAQIVDYLDQTVQAAAERAGVAYVDIADAFAGHELCSTSGQSYVWRGTRGNDADPSGGWAEATSAVAGRLFSSLPTGFVPPGGLTGLWRPLSNASFHPTRQGQVAWAQLFLGRFGSLPSSYTCGSGSSPNPCPSASVGAPPIHPWASSPPSALLQLGRLTLDLAPPGRLLVIAEGLRPDTIARFFLHSDLVEVGSVTVGADGVAAGDFPVGAIGTGSHEVIVKGTRDDGVTAELAAAVFQYGDLGDVDGDGLPDAEDLCPLIATDAPDANVDLDGNGVGEACDAPAPSLDLAATTVAEAQGAEAAVTMTLSEPSLFPVAVDYETVDGEARSPSDYVGVVPTTVTFQPGETVKSVMVPVVDDDVAESSEQFQVLLSNPRGASLLADAVTVTITDTDPVVIRPGGAGVVEGDDGTVTVDVPVSLSAPSASPVTVEWSTFDPGGSGLATSGVDYVAASGTVTFAPGETAASVRLTVNGDRVDEPDLLWGEWALVRFSNPSANATVDTAFYGLGIGVIFDDDPAPTIRPGGAGVVEGDDGTVTVDVPVTLSNPSASPVTVQWSTFDPGGSGVAAAGVDYEVASGTVTFAPGQTTAVVRLTVVGDTVVEPPLLWGEWVFVAFSSPVNATLDTSFYGLGIAVILDDD